MRNWVFLGAVYAQAPSQTRVSEPPFIWDVIQQPIIRPLFADFPKAGFPIPPQGRLRRPDDCHFPLDVVILQDATESFDDNIESMRTSQLDLIYEGITQKHPDTRFAVVSFKDKPITPLGAPDDYCTRFDTVLTKNITEVKEAYRGIIAYGGYDAPENQFGALYNVLATSSVGWTEGRTKLVVISTDAGPHFEGDSNSGILPAFSPSQVNDEDMEKCKAHYYPTPEQMKERILQSNAYVASLVYDGSWADDWPSTSWKTFNRFIGQSEQFVADQAPDSSNFWAKLAGIIDSIEQIECADHPTKQPADVEHLSTEEPDGKMPPDGECKCPCADCDCCPQVIIRLQHRPMSLHLDVDN